MSPIHAVHLSTVHHPHDTRILYRECGSLVKNDYQVSLLVCSDESVDIGGINVIRFPMPKSRRERMTSTAYKFIQKAIQLDADIYHFHDPELAPWMLLLRLRGKKVIFDVHENIMGSISDRSWIPKPLRPIVLTAMKICLPIIMNQFEVVFAERSYPSAYPWVKNYTIICNFPNIEFFPKKTIENNFQKFSIVYVGSITESRGIVDILDALLILKNRRIEVDFYLIGKANLAKDQDIKGLIDERNLSNVHVLGYIPQPEALEIVSRCHLGLAVLHPVKNYLLSYPTKIFEYMGCNLAFLTSDFPLYQEIIDKWQCGYTVQPESHVKLADAIEFCYANISILLEIGARGRKAVESEYNWSHEERNLLGLYEQILAPSNR